MFSLNINNERCTRENNEDTPHTSFAGAKKLKCDKYDNSYSDFG